MRINFVRYLLFITKLRIQAVVDLRLYWSDLGLYKQNELFRGWQELTISLPVQLLVLSDSGSQKTFKLFKHYYFSGSNKCRKSNFCNNPIIYLSNLTCKPSSFFCLTNVVVVRLRYPRQLQRSLPFLSWCSFW